MNNDISNVRRRPKAPVVIAAGVVSLIGLLAVFLLRTLWSGAL